jgi:hypothetical protein
MKNSPRNFIAILLAFLLFAQPAAFAWGNEGHYASNRIAARKLPDSMPRFLRKAVDRLAYLGPEPDRWRAHSEPFLKNAQEPDHYIDLERLEGFGELPVGRYDFLLRLHEFRATKPDAENYLPDKVGLQPYIVMEVYERLKAGFREYRALRAQKKGTKDVEHAIIFYAGWLGHYVADVGNPLHTTIHYDGWIGQHPRGYRTAKGFHWLFEGEFIKQNPKLLDFEDLIQPPTRLADPFQDYQRYLRDSFALVPQVYELEKVGGFKGAGTPESRDFTRRRLAAGTQMVLNMWYTAWLESEPPHRSSKTSS